MSPHARLDKLVVAFAMVFPTIVTYFYFVALAGQHTLIQQGGYAVAKVLQFGLPVWWSLVVMRERLDWRRPSGRGVALNVAFAVMVLAMMFWLYHGQLKPRGVMAEAAQAVGEKLHSLGIRSWAAYVAFALFVSLGHSFLEEYYWRWFVFRRLRRWTPLASACLLSSAAFMAHHVVVLGWYFGWASVWTYLFSLAVAVGGAVWAWTYERSGSLFGPWVSHVLVDGGIFVIGADMARW